MGLITLRGYNDTKPCFTRTRVNIQNPIFSDLPYQVQQAAKEIADFVDRPVFIFGSFAAGRWDEYSDLDVAIDGCRWQSDEWLAIHEIAKRRDFRLDLSSSVLRSGMMLVPKTAVI